MGGQVARKSRDEIAQACLKLVARWHGKGIKAVYGIPMGGLPVATEVAKLLGVPVVPYSANLIKWQAANGRVLVVDDLVDSGRTLAAFASVCACDALYRKPHSPVSLAPDAEVVDGWIVFPWENSSGPEDAVVRLIEFIGDNPNREGLIDTPRRVTKALREMTAGMREDPGVILGTVFTEQPSSHPVTVRGIRFTSMCEHHLLAFNGTCSVSYLPKDGRVVGLSKIPRLVECFARRPQLQERLSRQIAEQMQSTLDPMAVAVVVKAHHSCMGCRGVRQPDAEMITSASTGLWRDDLRIIERLERTL